MRDSSRWEGKFRERFSLVRFVQEVYTPDCERPVLEANTMRELREACELLLESVDQQKISSLSFGNGQGEFGLPAMARVDGIGARPSFSDL